MYIYIQSEHRNDKTNEVDLWTVGFYGPDGEWNSESDFNYEAEAANRVAFLNGQQHGGHPDQLTKRERFAMTALQGILANPSNSNLDLMGVNTARPLGFIAANFAAKEAVVYADELLKALDNATR